MAFTLDEFVVALGIRADTKPAEDLADAIDGVADAARSADAQTNNLGGRLSRSLGGALTIVGAAAAAIQTALLGAFAFFNSYISRAEELYNSKDKDLKITKDQLDMAKKYQEGLGALGRVIEKIRVQVAFSFLPAMLNAVETFNKLLESNRELIANGLSRFLSILARASQAITNTIRFIDMVITRTIGWEKALYVLGAAFLFVRRASILAFLLSPIGLFAAALVGIIILIDDFITYLDGGESEFGEFWGAMLEYIDIITPALRALWDLLIQGGVYLIELGVFLTRYLGGTFVDIVETIAASWALLVGILTGDFDLIQVAWDGLTENLLSAFSNFASLFEPLAQIIVSIFRSVFDKAKAYVIGVFNSIVGAVSAFVTRIGNALSNVFNIITSPFRIAFDWIINTFSRLPSLIGNIVSKLPGVNAITSIGSAVSSGVGRITNNYGGSTQATINVTSPNPLSAANQTAAALNNTQAQRNFGGVILG